MAAILNTISVRKKLVAASTTRKQLAFFRNSALTRFIFAKDDLLDSFDSHPVTQELLQNPSQEGSALVSHGSLSSFIGFEDASLEVGKLREFIREKTQLGSVNDVTIRETRNSVNLEFPVFYPSKQEIDEVTPTPDNWSSKSWTSLISEGIGNAANYVFRSLGLPNSRSGFGLQIKSPRKKGGSFRPMPYINEILQNFKKLF